MDLPLDAEVACTDGTCGVSSYVIVNPVTDAVTHVVVREAWFPHAEHLVTMDLVTETTAETIHLRCTKDDLIAAPSFTRLEYVDPGAVGYHEDAGAGVLLLPYSEPEDAEAIPVEVPRVPPGELAVRRGAHVHARDGRVGRVDEFLVDPASGHITHLILREGHLWGQKDVTIPVAEIGRIEEDTVYLNLTQDEIAALPSIRVRRR